MSKYRYFFCNLVTIFGLVPSYALTDASEPWQLGLQDPATPIMESMFLFHNYLMMFLIAVGVFVFLMLGVICCRFYRNVNLKAERFLHDSLLETFWNTVPAESNENDDGHDLDEEYNFFESPFTKRMSWDEVSRIRIFIDWVAFMGANDILVMEEGVLFIILPDSMKTDFDWFVTMIMMMAEDIQMIAEPLIMEEGVIFIVF